MKPASRVSIADSCRSGRRRTIVIGDGELGLVNGERKANAGVYDPAARAQWHGMLTYIARQRGYNPKWPTVNYKEKFGVWPPWGAVANPEPPTVEVLRWVKSRMIAYAKGRRSA